MILTVVGDSETCNLRTYYTRNDVGNSAICDCRFKFESKSIDLLYIMRIEIV